MRRLRATSIALMQVHNLVDVNTHLATLREWKKAGRIRYIGHRFTVFSRVATSR